MFLKLEDGLHRRAPAGGYAKFGSCENLTVLGLDTVVDGDVEIPAEQSIDEAPGRSEG